MAELHMAISIKYNISLNPHKKLQVDMITNFFEREQTVTQGN